jgi:carbamoyltransferase
MNILGISCFYHDSAACLVKDGKIIAAAQEERFTRKKHDFNFPHKAIEYVLKEGEINFENLDYIAFYDKPWIKFERILETYLAYTPKGLKSFMSSMPLWLKEKLRMDKLIKEHIKDSGSKFNGELIFTQHHESHAASAFYPSPFEEAAIITLDGVGEWTTTSYGYGKENKVTLVKEIRFPHSLGLLYSAFTYYTGFKVNSGEYKVMGLAPYGEPKYVKKIYENLITVKNDGSFKLNMKYFDYCAGLTMTNENFNTLFEGPPRKPETNLTQKEMDLAASIQKVTEDVILKIAKYVKNTLGSSNLCLAGGVALNCVANGLVLKEKIFENIWIQPAAGDAGGALGAALTTWYQYLDNKRTVYARDTQVGSYLGPAFNNGEIPSFIKSKKITAQEYSDVQLTKQIAKLIADEKVVGLLHGRMEFGPRALGARSIIGDARSPKMQSVMNLKIKFRESFRPFAPTILADKVSDWFELDVESPYMLLVAKIKEKWLKKMSTAEENLWGIERLNIVRSAIPAVTHVDYTARIQTINTEDNEFYYNIINEFYNLTGCPVIVNTSFNVRGEPIVCTPGDAYRCFMRTNMDFLVLGNYIIDKKDQQPLGGDSDWMKEFELD